MTDPLHPPAHVSAKADLRILAQECKSINARINDQDRKVLDEYRELGERLIQVKALVKHGEYGPWLDQHGISSQRSSDGVRVAENWSKVPPSGSLKEYLTRCDSIRLCSEKPPPPTNISSDADTSEGEEETSETPAGKPAGGAKPPKKPATTTTAKPTPPDPPAEPAIEVPARIKPHFDAIPLFKDAAQKAVRLANVLRDAEKTPAYKAVHEGQEVQVYSSTVNLIATNYQNDTPVRPCPEGCGEAEPSPDSDPCPKCGGKGYQTKDDIDNA